MSGQYTQDDLSKLASRLGFGAQHDLDASACATLGIDSDAIGMPVGDWIAGTSDQTSSDYGDKWTHLLALRKPLTPLDADANRSLRSKAIEAAVGEAIENVLWGADESVDREEIKLQCSIYALSKATKSIGPLTDEEIDTCLRRMYSYARDFNKGMDAAAELEPVAQIEPTDRG